MNKIITVNILAAFFTFGLIAYDKKPEQQTKTIEKDYPTLEITLIGKEKEYRLWRTCKDGYRNVFLVSDETKPLRKLVNFHQNEGLNFVEVSVVSPSVSTDMTVIENSTKEKKTFTNCEIAG